MRSIDQRARIILRQLLVAGVGKRPIIWISHSAGGILNKEILRISATHFADWTKNTDPIVPLELQEEISIPFDSFAFCDKYSSDDQTAFPTKVACTLPEVAEVAKNTSLIIFLSVPHRGGIDLNHYYLYPMTTKLTPEALDLQKDNPSILSLHAWFTIWASQRPIRIVNMVETKKLKVSALLPGMVIVPYDQRDEEYSEVFQVDADHETICKPETKKDEVYGRIVALILDQVFLA
uniref:Protein SERAC1 n=1 Tax=Schistocephalus solidus TaxID=70667 RepID=A0A0X3Q3K5_SCHSO